MADESVMRTRTLRTLLKKGFAFVRFVRLHTRPANVRELCSFRSLSSPCSLDGRYCRPRSIVWAEALVPAALADGRLTVAALREGFPATRALVWSGAVAEGAVQIELLPGRRA
jgi:hypothetical protein